MAKIRVGTKLGIICLKSNSYPQDRGVFKSCSYFMDTSEAGLRTAFKHIQVLDKKGENDAVHRNAPPLSTTASLN